MLTFVRVLTVFDTNPVNSQRDKSQFVAMLAQAALAQQFDWFMVDCIKIDQHMASKKLLSSEMPSCKRRCRVAKEGVGHLIRAVAAVEATSCRQNAIRKNLGCEKELRCGMVLTMSAENVTKSTFTEST